MPRNMRDQITKVGIATASVQRRSRDRQALDAGGEHEQEAGEERNRGGRMAGRVALVHREALEPVRRLVGCDGRRGDAAR